MVLLQVPVGHAVVQENAGISGDEAGTPGALDALKLADGVALAVHHHEAGGVLLLLPGAHLGPMAALWLGRLVGPGVARLEVVSGPLRVYQFCPFPGVFLGQQALDGNVNVIGVGHVGFPVDEGQLLGFDHEVDAFGSVAAEVLQVKVFHQVKFLQQDMAAGVGRGFVNGVAVVGGGNGFLPAGAAVGQVLQGEQPALIFAELDNGPGDFTLVESLPPAVNDGLEGACQVFLVADFAGLQGPSRRWAQTRPGRWGTGRAGGRRRWTWTGRG